MNTETPVTILTPANMHGAITEESIDVWCDFADQPAATNFDGGTHFCQYCGATDHKPLTANT